MAATFISTLVTAMGSFATGLGTGFLNLMEGIFVGSEGALTTAGTIIIITVAVGIVCSLLGLAIKLFRVK